MKRPSLPRTFLGAALLAFGVTFAGAAGRVNGQADGSEKVYQKTLKSTVWVRTKPDGRAKMGLPPPSSAGVSASVTAWL